MTRGKKFLWAGDSYNSGENLISPGLLERLSPLLFGPVGLVSANFLAFLLFPTLLYPYMLGFFKSCIQDNAVLALLQE